MTLEEQIQRRYQGQLGKAYHEQERSIPELAYPWVARVRAAKLAPYVRRQDTVLEYGVGTGWNLAELTCRRRLGYDIAEHLQSAAQAHGIEFITDLDGLGDASVDITICHHVLEHTPQPLTVLAEVMTLLRPGGTLLLAVPYEKERRYRCFDRGEPNHHLYSWNVQTLGNLVEDAGFAITEARLAQYGYDRFAAVWATRFKLGERGFQLLRSMGQLFFPLLEIRIVAERPLGTQTSRQ